MKLQFAILRIAELLVVLGMFASAAHSLLNNSVHGLIVTFLQRLFVLKLVGPLPEDATLLSPQLASAMILAPVLARCLILYALGREEDMAKIYRLSWLLLLPSVLWYSQLDWFQIARLPFNFQLFHTTLPFTLVLGLGFVLAAGRTFLFYTSQLRDLNFELTGRGATAGDSEKVFARMAIYTTLYSVGSALGAAVISLAIPVLKSLLSTGVAGLPYPYVVVGILCLTVVSACLIIYLHSHAEIPATKEKGPSKRTNLAQDKAQTLKNVKQKSIDGG